MNIGLMLFLIIIILLLVTVIVITVTRRHPAQELPTAILPVEKGESASLKYLKERCRVLEQRDVERKLYIEMTRVLSTVSTFDDLARRFIEAVCTHLHASRGALLWIRPEGDSLEFKHAIGFNEPTPTSIPVRASLAGASLMRKEPLFFADPRREVQYAAVGTGAETNVLCSPFAMFNEFRGVVRIANIDTGIAGPSTIISVFGQLMPLLSSALEKVLIAQENQRRKNELTAISGITQTLNRTLDIREICATCARHFKPIFNYSYFTIVQSGADDSLTPLITIPREIRFNESDASSRIILRNLCAPRRPLLIDDTRTSDLLKCQNREIGSLMVMPITIENQPFGSIVLTAAAPGALETGDLDTLARLSEHFAVTVERARHFRRQEEDAATDGLTGLLNRRSFQERLTTEFHRFKRYKRPFSLVMLDIDHFKQFNDRYGHQTGDLILRKVATMLRNSIRTTDFAFRYGGEEMALILPETALDPAALFSVRLCRLIASERTKSALGDLQVTLSAGVAQMEEGTADPEMIIKAADRALYHAKENGRNRVSLSRLGTLEKTTPTADG